MVERMSVTAEAAELIHRLRDRHGPLMFHQSGGCCDGSSPMCYPAGEFLVGSGDVLLGEIEGCPFYIGAAQFQYRRHTHPDRRRGSRTRRRVLLEAPEGVRFLTRSRLLADLEAGELECGSGMASG